jgi:O-antigen/teichoic acid export membrane protein
MKPHTRLGLNSLWLLGSRLGTQGLLALFTILIARRLGSAGFGEYAFMAAAIYVGNTLTTFGTDMLLMREIAARGDLFKLPAALLIQLALSALFAGLVWAGLAYFPHLSLTTIRAVQIYSLALFPLAFYTVFTSALRGTEHMRAYALLGLTAGLLQVGLAWLLPAADLISLAVGLTGIQILIAGLAGLLCAAQISNFWRGWRFSAGAVPDVLRASAPIGLLAVLGMTYQKLSIGMLSVLGGAGLTGGFAAALRVVEACKSAHMAVFTALYPLMARAQAKPETSRPLQGVGVGLLVGAALLALILNMLAAPLVNLLFGANFSAAIPALRILAWMLVPYTINTFLNLALVAGKQEPAVALALGISLAALFGLNLWLIPQFGLSGAAWAALAAESIQAGLMLSSLKKIHWLQGSTLKPGETHELPQLS